MRRPRDRASRSTRSSSSPTSDLSIDDGAIAPWAGTAASTSAGCSRRSARSTASRRRAVEEAEEAAAEGRCSTARARRRSTSATGTGTAAHASTRRAYEGVIPWLQAPPRRGRDRLARASRSRATCARCRAARAVAPDSSPRRWRCTIGGKNISEVGNLSIGETAAFFAEARAHRARAADRRTGAQGGQRAAAVPARRRPRLPEPQPQRPARSPAGRRSASGSRARSAAASSASSTCSTSRRSACTSGTTSALIETLVRLRDLGNTVLVVEHDEETIRVADHVVDIGPGAGEHGGEVVAGAV